jgi:hypothetical protein
MDVSCVCEGWGRFRDRREEEGGSSKFLGLIVFDVIGASVQWLWTYRDRVCS